MNKTEITPTPENEENQTTDDKDLNSASVNTKEKTIKGLFWGYLEKLGGEAVALVVSAASYQTEQHHNGQKQGQSFLHHVFLL